MLQSGEVDIDFDRIFTHSYDPRIRVTCNREEAKASQPSHQQGQPHAGGRQASSQPGRQAARQASKQARRQAAKRERRQQGTGKLAAEGDLGQFLKLGKNPLCLAAYLGNKPRSPPVGHGTGPRPGPARALAPGGDFCLYFAVSCNIS